MPENANEQQVEITGRACKLSAPIPLLGGAQVAAIYVETIHEVFNKFAKFSFVVFDQNQNPIMSDTETVEGEEYDKWDGNDLDFPYRFVCERRGLELETEGE